MTRRQSLRIDWNCLHEIYRRGEISAHRAIDKAAQMPARPPVGPISRCMLVVWAGCKGGLRGGPFWYREDGSFGISGDRSEPFLSRVCGSKPSIQLSVLLDLAEHEPAGAREVLDRIQELAAIATEELPNIGRMAMPSLAKQMHTTMSSFMIRLSDIAKEAVDWHPARVPRSMG